MGQLMTRPTRHYQTMIWRERTIARILILVRRLNRTPEFVRSFRSLLMGGPLFRGSSVYALESGDETNLPKLPVPFSQFFLSQDGVLCGYWPQKKEPVAQFVINESYVRVVLRLVHDEVIAGHPGKERTLSAARKSYYWPTMR